MSYMQGNIIQRESIAGNRIYRPSVLEASALSGLSRGSNNLRSTGAIPIEGGVQYEDPELFLPGSKIDIHILSNVSYRLISVFR